MAKLWDYFDGEPFLENPHLGIALLNRAKKGKKMAVRRKRRSTRRRGRKNATPRRRRTTRRRMRRNGYPMAGLVVNPRRRRRSLRRRNPRRRRGYRRNPSLLGFGLPPLNKVLFAGVGFIAPPIVEGFLSGFLPVSITGNKWGKLAIRALSVVGLTFAVRRFVGREEGNMVAIGGGVYVAASIVNEFAPGMIPWPQLGMYTPARGGLRGVDSYSPSTNVTAMPIGGSVGLPMNPLPQPKYHRSSR